MSSYIFILHVPDRIYNKTHNRAYKLLSNKSRTGIEAAPNLKNFVHDLKGKFGGKWISHVLGPVCVVEERGKSLSGQFFFVCEKDDREELSTKSLGGMTRPKDEMGSQIVSSESDISHPILVYLSWNNNFQAQARRFPAPTAPEPEFPVIFGSKWDPLTSAWRQEGASPERLAKLPTGISPRQKRIWKWDFYHCSSCNFFVHICFCHLWCELPL